MSLVAGTRLGPYEIQSAIGAGGPTPPSLAKRTHGLRRGLARAPVRANGAGLSAGPAVTGT